MQQIAGTWKHTEIVANGIDNEWPGDPLLVDDDLQMAIRMVNDNQSLALCIEMGSEDLKGHPHMDGLTVWIDPKGGKAEVFGIHVRGGSSMGPGPRPPAEAGTAPPTDRDHRRPGEKQPQVPPMEQLEQAAITYCDATGPLTMSMDEIRRTGIDIGVGHGTGRSLVYEFNIAFKAGPSLEDLKPGMVIGIGILSGGAEPEGRKTAAADGDKPQDGPPGRGGGPGPGGPMGRPGGMMGGGETGSGHGGPPSGAKQDHAGVWFQVQLAGGVQG